jgi:hypothetical protein
MDAYWPTLELVVEFNERQHSESVPHFDNLDKVTVSGVPRGGENGQRRIYDGRRDELIPAHGLRLVRIYMADFTVRRHHIVPEAADMDRVRQSLGL